MAFQGIVTGSAPNDNTGDTLLAGGIKINSNFTELYNLLGNGSTLAVGVVTNTGDASGVTGITTLIQGGNNISVTTNAGISTISYTGAANTSNINANTVNVSGIVTATSFNGSGASLTGVLTALNLDGADGSGLTGVVTTLTGADGSGLTGVVTTLTGADASGVTGITTLISAGSNITVETTAGITTITSSAGGGSTANVSTNTLVVTGVSTVGVVTGATYFGDASDITSGKWTLGAVGSSHYQFTGPGGLNATADPVIYLARGQSYEFVNNMGAHPFEIRESNGGSAFSTGVTNNAVSNGTLRFDVPYSAPNSLYYQCTSHAGMGGTIVVYPNLFTV
jgi:hypothetical protein